MNTIKNTLNELHSFIILWLTQSLSQLGSSMTNFALIIWSYQAEGTATATAMLSVCSYAPYVLMSIFAGSLSDRWNKKAVMLISDTFAALCSGTVFVLLLTGRLKVWHLYVLNALNGLMNTVQQPAADTAITLLIPKKYYQLASGMRSFSSSAVGILTPSISSALLAFAGIYAVIFVDFMTFLAAFLSLLLFIKIPSAEKLHEKAENILKTAKSGLVYLKNNRGIFDLMLFLAAINLIASAYEATLPAMILSKSSETALGAVNTTIGLSTLAGSLIISLMPAPKSRVKVICNTLLVSMSTENFFLAFGSSTPVWCIGAALGWILIPVMNANMDVLFRERIPVEMQGRVYSARNTFQFFTIPIGYLLGGLLTDKLFEPFMAAQDKTGILCSVFGNSKGAGAALFFFVLAIAGVLVCLIFRRDKHIRELE